MLLQLLLNILKIILPDYMAKRILSNVFPIFITYFRGIACIIYFRHLNKLINIYRFIYFNSFYFFFLSFLTVLSRLHCLFALLQAYTETFRKAFPSFFLSGQYHYFFALLNLILFPLLDN